MDARAETALLDVFNVNTGVMVHENVITMPARTLADYFASFVGEASATNVCEHLCEFCGEQFPGDVDLHQHLAVHQFDSWMVKF